MATSLKTPTTADEIETRALGSNAFVFDISKMMTSWMSLSASGLQAWQSELTSFVANRLEHDRLTMQRFAGCRDLVQAAKVQQEWFADAFASYLEEGRRLTAIMTEPAVAAAS